MANEIPAPQILLDEVFVGEHVTHSKRSRRRRSRLKIDVRATRLATEAIQRKARYLNVKAVQIVKRQHIPLFIQRMRLLNSEDYWFKDIRWADRQPNYFRDTKKDHSVKLFVHKDYTFIFTGTASLVEFRVDLIHENDEEGAYAFYDWCY